MKMNTTTHHIKANTYHFSATKHIYIYIYIEMQRIPLFLNLGY